MTSWNGKYEAPHSHTATPQKIEKKTGFLRKRTDV